jgi:hypothetical protein
LDCWAGQTLERTWVLVAEKGGRGGYHSRTAARRREAAAAQSLEELLHEANCTFSSGQERRFKWPYVMRICEAMDAAGGGAHISRAPPALPQQAAACTLGAVAGLSTAPAGQLQASAGVVRARLPILCAVAVQSVAERCAADDRVPGLAPSCTPALAAGARDAPRALSFPRKKSLTRTTY